MSGDHLDLDRIEQDLLSEDDSSTRDDGLALVAEVRRLRALWPRNVVSADDGQRRGEGMSDDLADFLLARIAEDETEAQYVHDDDCGLVSHPHYSGCTCHLRRRTRTMADCGAKRQVVALHSEGTFERGGGHLCHDSMIDQCETLQLLALPYAEHEDYRHDDWDPDHQRGVCVQCDET